MQFLLWYYYIFKLLIMSFSIHSKLWVIDTACGHFWVCIPIGSTDFFTCKKLFIVQCYSYKGKRNVEYSTKQRVGRVCRMNLKFIDKLWRWIPHNRIRKQVHANMGVQTVSQSYSPANLVTISIYIVAISNLYISCMAERACQRPLFDHQICS